MLGPWNEFEREFASNEFAQWSDPTTILPDRVGNLSKS